MGLSGKRLWLTDLLIKTKWLPSRMNHFSISDIENLTRIKAHTLRIWEQRYSLFVPKRTLTGHRYYDNDDLKKLLRISTLYFNGYKISRIARFSEEEIREKTVLINDQTQDAELFLNNLTEASIDLDEQRFRETLLLSAEQLGFETMIFKVVFPFLKRLGVFWLTGHIIPSQEHFASTLITHRIIAEMEALPPPVAPHGTRKVLLFTPEKEHHEIPLLVTAYQLKKNGIPFTYLGRNISLATLKTFYEAQRISQFYFHIITNFTGSRINEYIRELGEAFPESEIFFSGISPVAGKPVPGNVFYLSDAGAIEAFSRGVYFLGMT